MAVGKFHNLAQGAGGETIRKPSSNSNIIAGNVGGAALYMYLESIDSKQQLFATAATTPHNFTKIVSNVFGQYWALDTDNKLWRFSPTDNGFSSYSLVSSWTQFGTDTDWEDISAGLYHFMAIKSGELYAMGYNPYGQCGFGSTTYYTSLTQVGAATDWAMIECGNDFSVAVKTDGTLYSCGRNSQGRTGLGTTSGSTLSFTQVGSYTNVLAVSCCENQFLFIEAANDTDDHGAVYGTGYNGANSMGFATTGTRTSPAITTITTGATSIGAGANRSIVVKDGDLYMAGYDTGMIYWTSTSSGSKISGFVKDNNTDGDFEKVWGEGTSQNTYHALVKKNGKHYLLALPNHAYMLNNQTTTLIGSQATAVEDWSFFSDNSLTVSNVYLAYSPGGKTLFISLT